jgi:ABC-type transport system involved in cytochrome bd biosynthesis fused ATPase/permease subunit
MMTQSSIDRTIDNRVSDLAAESTFREIDDTDRAIPAIEFRDVTMIFDDRKILDNLSFKVMKGETKIILGARLRQIDYDQVGARPAQTDSGLPILVAAKT